MNMATWCCVVVVVNSQIVTGIGGKWRKAAATKAFKPGTEYRDDCSHANSYKNRNYTTLSFS